MTQLTLEKIFAAAEEVVRAIVLGTNSKEVGIVVSVDAISHNIIVLGTVDATNQSLAYCITQSEIKDKRHITAAHQMTPALIGKLMEMSGGYPQATHEAPLKLQ